MIAPMLKYQFLAFYRDVEHLLELLKGEGVVHIKKVKKEVDEETASMRRSLVNLAQYQKLLERHQPESEPAEGKTLPDFQPEQIGEYLEELQQIAKDIPRLEEEEYHVRSFGHYDRDKLKALEKKGIWFHLYSIGKGKIKDEWRKDYLLEELFTTGRKIYFALITESPEAPTIKAQAEEFPDKSTPELKREIEELKQRKADIRHTLWARKDDLHNYLTEERKKIENRLQDKRAEDQMVNMGFGKVILLQGWTPKEKAPELEKALDDAGYYYERIEPEEKDHPPILLQNHNMMRWFEPIAKLFALPHYRELDLTPFFAPFFLLFFGFCLGDGGYGLLLLILLLIFRKRFPPEYRDIWKLAVSLEAVAIPMGILGGTFLGVNLLETELPVLRSLRPIALDADKLFNLALAFGAVQIYFGLILRAVNQTRQFGWQYALSPFGWMLLITGLGWGYVESFSAMISIISWTGVGLIVIFSDPRGGIGTRLGKGLWDLYGITGLFGDLLSYIRLFALGLAGSILGFVVNDIALSIKATHPFFGPLFFAIMLIVGHGLNIFIATLGAFVHPMRLTFVEFYKNAGFTGGGEAYQPLKEIKPKTDSQ